MSINVLLKILNYNQYKSGYSSTEKIIIVNSYKRDLLEYKDGVDVLSVPIVNV